MRPSGSKPLALIRKNRRIATYKLPIRSSRHQLATQWQREAGICGMGRRGPRCTVCAHPKRHLIEVGLAYGVPIRQLAARFDGVSPHAVHRHRHNHLSPAQAAAILCALKPSEIDLEALQRSESEGLLGQLVSQRARLMKHSEIATQMGAPAVAISAENAIQSNLSLVAKLLGQLVTRHEVKHTSLLISPDYIKLRQAITVALLDFPDAARAVAAALHALEDEAGEAMKAGASKPLLIEAASC